MCQSDSYMMTVVGAGVGDWESGCSCKARVKKMRGYKLDTMLITYRGRWFERWGDPTPGKGRCPLPEGRHEYLYVWRALTSLRLPRRLLGHFQLNWINKIPKFKHASYVTLMPCTLRCLWLSCPEWLLSTMSRYASSSELDPRTSCCKSKFCRPIEILWAFLPFFVIMVHGYRLTMWIVDFSQAQTYQPVW